MPGTPVDYLIWTTTYDDEAARDTAIPVPQDYTMVRVEGVGIQEFDPDIGRWVTLLAADNINEAQGGNVFAKSGSQAALLPMPNDLGWDAFVDTRYSSLDTLGDPIYDTLGEAIERGHVSIFVRDATDVNDITIGSSLTTQRIQGLDADTTTVPVNITCNKDNVTFEQLGFDGTTLTCTGNAADNTQIVRESYFTGGGKLVMGTGSPRPIGMIDGVRFNASTSTVPLELGASTTLQGSIFINASANHATLKGQAGLAISRDLIVGNRWEGPATASITTDTNTFIQNALLVANQFNIGNSAKYAFDGVVLSSVIALNAITTGQLRITAPAADNLLSTVLGNVIEGTFTNLSADANAEGLILAANIFTAGTINGSQDAVWGLNYMAGRTVDFQSKTGMYVIGGDMTGATLQNIPADIYMSGVKGQSERGHRIWATDNTWDIGDAARAMRKIWTTDLSATGAFTPGTITGSLLPTADNTYDVGSVAASWRDLFVDRNALVGGTLGVTGLTTVANLTVTGTTSLSHLLPDGDNTRDLGSAALSWNDLFLDGNLTLSATTRVTGAHLLFSLDNTYDIGASSATRPKDLYLGGSWKQGTVAMDLTPEADNTRDLGTLGLSWKNANIQGTLTLVNLNLTNSVSDIIHSTDNTGFLGSSSFRWAGVYAYDLDLTDDLIVGDDARVGSDLTLGAAVRAAYGLTVENATSTTAIGSDNIRMGVSGGAPYLILEDNGVSQFMVLNTLSTLIVQGGSANNLLLLTSAGGLVCSQPTVGNKVFAITSTATNDDPVDEYYHGRVATTDATVTTINTIAITASRTYQLEAHVVARRTGGTAGTADDGAVYVVQAGYTTKTGTVTLLGAVNADHTGEDQAAWDATFTISGTNVLLQVTGAANNNVSWNSTVRVRRIGT